MARTEQSQLFGNTNPIFNGNAYRLEIPSGSRLRQLRFQTEDWLTAIQFVMIDRNGMKTESAIVGSPRIGNEFPGFAHIVTLDEDEFITAIAGQAASRDIGPQHFQRISALNLHTNKRVQTVSSETATGAVEFTLSLANGAHFAGFFGTLAVPQSEHFNFINNVGILFRPVFENPLVLQTNGLFQDRDLKTPEGRLKRNEHAFLKVTITNTSDLLVARGVFVGLAYDAQTFNDRGVTVEIPPIDAQGELNIGDLVAGESKSVPVKVSTSNLAAIQDYQLAVKLLRYSFALDQGDVAIPSPVPTTVKVSP